MILNNYNDYTKNKKRIRHEDESIFESIIEILDYPLHWLRKLTIPPVEEEHYDHFYLIIWPFLGILFLVLNFYPSKYEFYFYSIPVAFIISFIFFNFSN